MGKPVIYIWYIRDVNNTGLITDLYRQELNTSLVLTIQRQYTMVYRFMNGVDSAL